MTERNKAFPTRSILRWMLIVFGIIVIVIFVITIWLGLFLGVRQITYLTRRNTWNGFSLLQLVERTKLPGGIQANETPDGSNAPQQDSPINTPVSQPPAEFIPWDGVGRVTVLILGLDYRDWESRQPSSRSDTMILLTLDPLTRRAGILSIPRDLWVAIPGFKNGKINTAHYLGDSYKVPGGGPALASRTVEEFIGVPVNYYAVIDFNAFIRFIDEIGGLKVDVKQPITVDLLGSGPATKKKLQPGIQVLPGSWALGYARARYTDGSDFDRAERQQQVILAIRNRILSFEMLPTLIGRAPVLYQELASGVRTNLTVEEAIRLSILASQIPDENIHRGVINQKYVLFGTSLDGLSILIPIPDKIFLLRDEIFSPAGAFSPLTLGTDQERMKTEAARVSVINATSSGDLGERTVAYLSQLGVSAGLSASSQSIPATTITIHSGKPYTLKYLVGVLGVSPYRIRMEYVPGSPLDIEVMLGEDWARSNSLP